MLILDSQDVGSDRKQPEIDPDQLGILSGATICCYFLISRLSYWSYETFSVDLLCRSPPLGQGFLLLGAFNHASHFPVGTNPHQLI